MNCQVTLNSKMHTNGEKMIYPHDLNRFIELLFMKNLLKVKLLVVFSRLYTCI
jgi:hypothetical protein